MDLRRSLDRGSGTRPRRLAFRSVALLALILALGMASPTMASGDSDGDGLTNGAEGSTGRTARIRTLTMTGSQTVPKSTFTPPTLLTRTATTID